MRLAIVIVTCTLVTGCASKGYEEPVRRVILTYPSVYQPVPKHLTKDPSTRLRHKKKHSNNGKYELRQNNYRRYHNEGRRRSTTGYIGNDPHSGFTVMAPLDRMIVTSPFGERRGWTARSGGGIHQHNGVDLRASVGTPVMAPRESVVRSIRRSSGYGLVVELDHGHGWISLFAHLSKVKVYRGQRVHQGQVIALSGNSGKTTGAHLHWELRHQGRAVNPHLHMKR